MIVGREMNPSGVKPDLPRDKQAIDRETGVAGTATGSQLIADGRKEVKRVYPSDPTDPPWAFYQ